MISRFLDRIRRKNAPRMAGPSDEEVMAHMAAQTFLTGKTIFGERLPDGSVQLYEVPAADEPKAADV